MSSIFWGFVSGSALVLTACGGGSGESEPDGSGGTGGNQSNPNTSGVTSGSSSALACGATADGASETRPCFEAASVPPGQRCQSTLQTRMCDSGTWNPDYPSCAHLSCTVEGPMVTPGTIFHSDFESGALDEIFLEANIYGAVVGLSTDVAHSGTSAVKITYPHDEAGVELKVAPFPATTSLFTRKYEYFAPGWEGNWPVGLKTSRYFTRDDFATGEEPDAWAYGSEKLIWQSYEGDPNDEYGRGLNVAIFNLDLVADYASGTSFGNGQPYIRTGHWYKMETWMVLNSAVDVADGVLRIWIDDQVVYDQADVIWRSTDRGVPNGEGWQSMWFGGNYSGATFGSPSVAVDRYIDDAYLSTTLDR